MSLDQATENNDEIIDTDETVETDVELEAIAEGEAPEVETDEIIVDGEEQPASKPVPLKSFLKRVDKLNGKVVAANDAATAAEKKALMLEEENKLLRLKAEQQSKPTLTKPKYEDFDTDAEFEAAQTTYDDQRIEAAVIKKTEQLISDQNNSTTQTAQVEQLNTKLEAHYERAETLKVTDYETVEDQAIEILGNDITKQIMANTEKSHILMYHLGKNQDKAKALATLLKTEPVKGVLELGRLEASLKVKSKNSSVPEPEEKVSGSAAAKTNGKGRGITYE